MASAYKQAAGPDDVAARNALIEATSGIISRLDKLAADQVRAKSQIEERWLEDLRHYHGRYDSTTEAALKTDDRSRAFVNLTRAKTNSMRARLSDLLFPADDRNWGIDPTPVPELAHEADAAAREAEAFHAAATADVEQANSLSRMAGTEPGAMNAQKGALLASASEKGQLAIEAEDRMRKARFIMDEAKKRAEAMEREIDDVLTECRYPARSRDVIDDAVKLGPGIMKGPLTSNRPKRSWTTQGNVATLDRSPNENPEYRRVDPWQFFPEMNATSMDDCEFTFERHLPSPKELRRMAKTLGFDKDAVRELLTDGPERGSSTDLNHLTQLRALTGEGEAVTNRFIVWEYHGPLECEEICLLLKAAGRPEDADEFAKTMDPLDEQMVVLWFAHGKLLKLTEDYVLDSFDSLYSIFSYEKAEAGILSAIGVPRIMYDAQKALNGAWRMMLDNAALSAGPQVVIDKTQVEPEDGDWKLRPRKVWIKKGQELQGQSPPFAVYHIPMNQAQLAGIIELALKFIDEETALPMLAQGEQGPATQTMGGMSMLFNSANVVFRRIVKQFDDDLTTPVISRLYQWKMQFSDKAEIKGDMQVEARGTSVLLVRELQIQQLMMLLTQWAGHPVLGLGFKDYNARRMVLQALGINPDDILEPKDEFEKLVKRIAEAGPERSPEQIRAEAQVTVAQMTLESRKAEAELQLMIEEIRRETQLMQLAEQNNMEVEKLRTMLALKRIDVDSNERIFAAEAAVEQRQASEAAATGAAPPAGSGGYLS